MRARIQGIVLPQAAGQLGGELPVAHVAGDAAEGFDAEGRFAPRVGSGLRAQLGGAAADHDAALLAVATAQKEFALHQPEIGGQRRGVGTGRLELAQRRVGGRTGGVQPVRRHVRLGGSQVTGGTKQRRLMRDQPGGGGQRFLRRARGDEEGGPGALADLFGHERRPYVERLAQPLARRAHLPGRSVGRRQQQLVVVVVPVVLRPDVLRLEIGLLERLGAAERGDGLDDPAGPPQTVAVHVVRVRNGRDHARVKRRVLQRRIGAPGVLVGMDQVMMRGELFRRQRERPLVERHRASPARHRRSTRVFVGLAAQEQQFDIPGKTGQRAVQRRPIRRGGAGVAAFHDGVELLTAERDAKPVTVAGRRRQRPCRGELLTRALQRAEAAERDAQSEVRHGEIRVGGECGVKRAGRLDPHK